MTNFDPIPRLQQIAATIEDGGHFDSPATAAHYINWCFECGGANDGSLNQLLYDLARKEVNDVFDRDNPVYPCLPKKLKK